MTQFGDTIRAKAEAAIKEQLRKKATAVITLAKSKTVRVTGTLANNWACVTAGKAAAVRKYCST
ncbi:MAG: hypothetical protein LBT46_09025 [Planctomycetaceae bacterium]|jgi:hypothetical protein|nr:hypothetical protein [Planctomycetaceae bacterium]